LEEESVVHVTCLLVYLFTYLLVYLFTYYVLRFSWVLTDAFAVLVSGVAGWTLASEAAICIQAQGILIAVVIVGGTLVFVYNT
jgi:hypothetical protein